MTESTQHTEDGGRAVKRQAYHNTLIRWPREVFEEVRAAALNQEMNFGAFVRLAARKQLERIRKEKVA